MVRSSAQILATPPYHGLPSDWDELKAFSDGFTPAGTFRSPYSFLIDAYLDGGVTYYGAFTAYQPIYGGFSATNHHIGGVDGADCSAVVQVAVNAIHEYGGCIAFRAEQFKFKTKITFPDGSHSIKFIGECHSDQAHTLAGMPIAGTIFKSEVINDDMFHNDHSNGTWNGVTFGFEDITFIGPNSNDDLVGVAKGDLTLNRGLHFTNLDGLNINDCGFFGFGYGILGDYQGTLAGPMPGMGDIHDNLFSEMGVAAIKFDRFMQSKIHNNEFEAWGDFLRHIELVDTNTININNNRFSVPVDRVPSMTEVIKISTTSDLYCNQILVSDNIVGMGNGTPKYPFIRMTNTTAAPVYPAVGIVSRDNLLQYDYTPAFTDTPYIIASPITYGDLDAHDFHLLKNDRGGNLQDLNVTCPVGSWYQNQFSPLQLHLQCNTISTGETVTVSLGKTTTAGDFVPVQYFINSEAQDCVWNTMFEVPSLWYFKVEVTGGAKQAGLYGVYR